MIVIDTHVLVWWAGGTHERLSKPARDYDLVNLVNVELPMRALR